MPGQLFLPSDLLHSRDFLSTLRASSADTAGGGCSVTIVHKDSTSLYKATRKARRTAERVGTACASASNGDGCESCASLAVCKCYFVGRDQAFSPSDGPKEYDTMHKRLSSEFGTVSSLSIDGQNVAVREYKSDEGSGTHEERLNVVFFDLDALGGLSAPNASAAKLQYDLMQGVLSSIFPKPPNGTVNLIVHVRSEALHHCIASAGTKRGSRCIGGVELEERLVAKPDESEEGENETSPIRRLRNKKGAANCPLTIYPARYVELPASGGDGDEATRRVEICRFHNYDERGCLRSQKAAHNPDVKGCDMDHDHCHRCGGSHRAMECQNVDDGQLSSVVFRKTPGGDTPSVTILEDAAIHQPTQDAFPALLVLGGRLRGRTLATCEMLPLASSKNDQRKWEALPNLSEHRGSHAACALPGSGVAFVLGGGTADGNSDTTEMLDFGLPGNDKREWGWKTMARRLSSPRHAFEAVTCVASEQTGDAVKTASLFAVGGWMYGSKSCESVERLTYEYLTDNGKRVDGTQAPQKNGRWELCAPLLLPRRLHSVVASSDGSSIYVFGGYIDERRTTSSIERYDIETNRWAALDELPFGHQNCPLVQAVADGASFVVFPFSTQDGETPLVQRYNPGSDEPFAPVIVPGTGEQLRLPIPNWHSFSATSSSSLSKAFLVGGTIRGGRWTDRSFELDLLKMEWNELPPMTFARRRLATVVLE